jgi:(4S)-4-hydroxy-5-phosphonooxypentane-2,3-dione isomerase
MYVICSQLLVKEGREEAVAAVMPEIVAASRTEPGCLMYVAHRHLEDARRFMFYEQYVDEAAFNAHTESEHYQRLVVPIIAPSVESRERGVYDRIGEPGE